MIKFSPLSSSWIESASYDDTTKELELTFRTGSTRTFGSVEPEVFDALVSAPSPGKYYHQLLKGS